MSEKDYGATLNLPKTSFQMKARYSLVVFTFLSSFHTKIVKNGKKTKFMRKD